MVLVGVIAVGLPLGLLYINYILLQVGAALRMNQVILSSHTSRLSTPAAIKDGLLLVLLLSTGCVLVRKYTLVAGVVAYQYLVQEHVTLVVPSVSLNANYPSYCFSLCHLYYSIWGMSLFT